MSILVILEKVFEKYLEHQLIEYFNPILSPSLSAYRRGYSCELVPLRFIEDWRSPLDNKCGLSKAFDMIPCNLFLTKLAAYGISCSSLFLSDDYLRGRTQRVKTSLSERNCQTFCDRDPQVVKSVINDELSVACK